MFYYLPKNKVTSAVAAVVFLILSIIAHHHCKKCSGTQDVSTSECCWQVLKELVQNFGRYDTVSKNQAVDAAGLMQVLPLIHSLVQLEPKCEIHTQPLRQALSKMVMDDPSVNNSKFQGAVWCNLRQERLTCVMAHFRRLKNDAEMRKCASRLTAAEYLQLQDVVDKIEVNIPLRI